MKAKKQLATPRVEEGCSRQWDQHVQSPKVKEKLSALEKQWGGQHRVRRKVQGCLQVHARARAYRGLRAVVRRITQTGAFLAYYLFRKVKEQFFVIYLGCRVRIRISGGNFSSAGKRCPWL